MLAVVAGLLAIYALILHYAFGATDFQLPATANVTSPVLVAATLIAGALTAAYAVLRLRAHLLAEARGKLDAHGDERADERHRSEQEVAFTERFAKAVALLADRQPISRIAGAHLIFALGDEWSRDGAQQRCLDVLISHLRALRDNESFEDEAGSRGVREEVRLVTSELLRRLAEGSSSWSVRAGDFSGVLVADFDLTEIRAFPMLDLRGAKVLGDLTIPTAGSVAAPKLSGIVCEGDLNIEWADGWEDLDLSGAQLRGSASVTGRTLRGLLNATDLHTEGDLGFGFESFEGDVILDSAEIGCSAVVGSSELGATFGTEAKPTLLSLVGASFQEFKLRRSVRGPQLDLTDAVGAVDLSHSVFPIEVTGNRLDASSGLYLRGARFEGALVLNEAAVPASIDLDGLFLSDSARSAISSSEFALRDRLLQHGQEKVPARQVEQDVAFDWRSAVEPLRERLGEPLMSEVEDRLQRVEADLALDWHTRPPFTARVMSEVARAVAKTDTPRTAEEALQAALRRALPLAPTGEESA
ncbi:hypothetical protein [Micrococcus terreus]|uniref:hypothetical protein n=1 Tax=Micrococcus terreus TaxID=574650 RepID=UPI003015D458